MAIRERLIEYRDGSTLLEGFFCHDDSRPGPLPGLLIAHDWSGRGEFVERKARRLAWHGFATFALDMFGKGKRGTTNEECARHSSVPSCRIARCSPAALPRRSPPSKGYPEVDTRRVAAMGFCFGGMCVLDLARSGADVRGVTSFHGHLKPSGLPSQGKIRSKVLMLHGYDDPMGPPEDVLAVGEGAHRGRRGLAAPRLRQHHARVHESAGQRSCHGMVYDEAADRRAWHTLLQFLDEVLR